MNDRLGMAYECDRQTPDTRTNKRTDIIVANARAKMCIFIGVTISVLRGCYAIAGTLTK